MLSSCSVEGTFASGIFYCKSLLVFFGLDLHFFSFCCIWTRLCVLSSSCLFRAFIFSVILSCTPASIWEWRILCSNISLMPYFCLLILPYFPLSQGIWSSSFLHSLLKPAWRNAYTQVSGINSSVFYSQ